MKVLISVLLISSAFSVQAQTFSGPESVEFDPVNNRYIVSNTTSGNLQAVIPGNSPVLFTSAVGSPYGLAVADSTVYVNDQGKVVGFNLVTGLQTFTSSVMGGFLNGLCADGSGHLYATDFSGKKIYKINIADGTTSLFVANTVKTPNGILYDAANSRLVYCTWGSGVQIKSVSLADSSQTVLMTTTLSNDDGIVMDNQGRFYISVWGTQSVYMIDSGFVNQPVQVISGLSNPADICYNLNNDTLGVPNSGNNTVNFYNMAFITAAGDAGKQQDFIRTYSDQGTIRIVWHVAAAKTAILEFFSLQGKLLATEVVTGSGEYRIAKEKFPAGIYVARINSGGKRFSEKFFAD